MTGRAVTATATALLILGGVTACGAGAKAGLADGDVHGRWHIVYAGHGEVSGNDQVMTLAPKAATSRDTTHGALVVDPDMPADLTVRATMTTTEQLREGGHPNPWEVGWLLWRYTDDEHFYAVALKPNGWELSKQDPAYPGNQRFLATGRTPTFPFDQPHTVEVTHVGNVITLHADGHALTRFVDTERPYPAGGLGLYTEDARVVFSDIEVVAATSAPRPSTSRLTTSRLATSPPLSAEAPTPARAVVAASANRRQPFLKENAVITRTNGTNGTTAATPSDFVTGVER